MMGEEDKIIKYIMLTQMDGIGPVTQNALIDLFGTIGKCFDAGYEEIRRADISNMIGRKRAASFVEQRDHVDIRNRAEQIMKDAEYSGIKVVVREDDTFPERFRKLMDMPILLYVKGNLKINKYRESAGIVGSRRCSKEGKTRAIDIVSESVRNDTAIISGMAKGIDSYAHTAAIKSEGYTIAVLGNGADICYPKEHDQLYSAIAEKGCIVSEYPPGTPPRQYYFPRRNRIIAALSDRLYVIDAGRNSGTQTTVEYARRYGKRVLL